MDFFDLKGVVDGLLRCLGLEGLRYEQDGHPSFHPGRAARVWAGSRPLGMLGELHPLVAERYDLPESPLLAAELDVEAILASVPARRDIRPVPAYPPVLEDLAVIVDEAKTAEQVETTIRSAGSSMVADVRLFDLYRGDQVGAGRKSLAYSITYQASDRTLTDEEVAQLRARIVRRLEADLGARIRS
jgi:phenylalanyl-tRNA synthetase beta chain